jgi:hypothetical protein
MTVVYGTALSSFEVSPDGTTMSINVIDADKECSSLVLPTECLKEMIMTLPEMMGQALRRRYRDPSLRLVYPLGRWRLEGSTEPAKLILTLSTIDGFAVSFSVAADQLTQMANDARTSKEIRLPLRN